MFRAFYVLRTFLFYDTFFTKCGTFKPIRAAQSKMRARHIFTAVVAEEARRALRIHVQKITVTAAPSPKPLRLHQLKLKSGTESDVDLQCSGWS